MKAAMSDDTDYTDVLYEKDGHVVTITLNRPERRAYEGHLPYQLYAMHVNSKMARRDLEEGQNALREKRKPQWQGLKKNKEEELNARR